MDEELVQHDVHMMSPLTIAAKTLQRQRAYNFSKKPRAPEDDEKARLENHFASSFVSQVREQRHDFMKEKKELRARKKTLFYHYNYFHTIRKPNSSEWNQCVEYHIRKAEADCPGERHTQRETGSEQQYTLRTSIPPP